ncbi:interleukin-21 receptor [Anableps anableps]
MMMMVVMERRPPLRLKLLPLILLLLNSTCLTWLQEDPAPEADFHLECVNDYLYTINCSLNVLPAVNTSVRSETFWLTVAYTSDEKEYKCLLKNATAGFFCSLNRSWMAASDYVEIFSDLDKYEISFCQDGDSETCEVLEKEYEPKLHIKPNVPCCLTVTHNATRHHFTWNSTYESYSSDTALGENLMYQLQFDKTGDKDWQRTHNINGDSTTHSVEDENFDPGTEYAVKVRSSPNMHHYRGQWSEWSSEVLWRTEGVSNAVSAIGFISNLPVVFSVLCAMVVLVLICFSSVKKWRRSTFIPTPAPYFHTLYKDCHGDFKSWVATQENMANVLKAEEALQIDHLVERVEVRDYQHPAPFQQQFMENRAYSNIPASAFDGDLLSMQCADGCTMAWLLDQGRSVRSLGVYCQSCSPAQDSGCWLCSDTSLEKEPSWYCNDYCTLSCLQQAAAGRHGDGPQMLNSL